MNWYKHDTNAATDAKIRKLVIKYGAEGYAVYFHCLELIASDINENNITFELEHDAEIIADNLKIKSTPECASIDKVNEIMKYIVDLNLFQESEGRIFCFKLLKRLDTSMTSSPKFRAMIQKAKENHDAVMINPDSVMQDKIRIEENREEENKSKRNVFKKPSISDIMNYMDEKKITSFTPDYFYNYNEARGWMIGKNKMKDWKAAIRQWHSKNKQENKSQYKVL